METNVFGASNPFSVEGSNMTVDPDLYAADSYDFQDAGLRKKNELSFPELVPKLFVRNSWWQNMTPSARARQLWLLLRTRLHNFVEKGKKSELHVACLTHGLEPLRRLEVAAGLCSVAQDPVGRRFVVLDRAGCLHLHREDGWAQEKLLAPVALTGLVAVLGPLGSVGRFVGWGPAGLAILRPDLSLLWLSEPGMGRSPYCQPICCLPVPDLGLLLVAEAGGGLALWKFRLGGRCLVPCGSSLQPQLSSTCALTRLALGPLSPNYAPCCFAAYGSAVLTFDLHTWAVIDVRQDLHKTTISDLAYCREVKAMVTASRDSTVKVWEADWQIRMVFVGHTGPVTAMAVLPNTSLVLSASQDGTLRTWDLQEVAQVGEVKLNCWDHGGRSGYVNTLLAPAGLGWPVFCLCAGSVELWCLRELYSPLAQLPAPVLHLQVAPELPLPPHPPLPARLVCACTDGCVYLLSVATGHVVSVLLLEPEDCAAAVAYCLPREVLWLLTRAGHLVRANAARCPMCVLHRVGPPPPPEPRPCCLHLYSHLTDPSGAFAIWEMVRQHKGELSRRDIRAWKDKNRYLPVVGHTDGTLSVLNWHTSTTVFQTEAHSPGPVTAIASTWNSIVTSGGDLTVKVWRVFPYAEESLSLLHTFSCCHPCLVLCVLAKCVTVAFEDPDNATYGLVQLCLDNLRRYDHQPQDDHMDHITGLCCCPTLKLYASSSLDCTIRIWTTQNRLLRLLQLNGAPQALAFCSNNGDLVLALGSRLCLVSHRLYLPTSYLIKKLCQKVPDVVHDPPLPLTSQELLTSAQLQRLANLQGVASLSTALSSTYRQTTAPQQPLSEENLDALVARDQDLQQLRQRRVVPQARPPTSWKLQKEAFDNYLYLIYGPTLLDLHSKIESQRWSSMALTVEKKVWDVCTLSSRWKAEVSTDVPKAPPQDWGTLSQHFHHPSRVILPIPGTHQREHSRTSELLARSSLSSSLGLSMDLQLQSEPLFRKGPVAPDPSSSHRRHRVPLLLERRPKELLSNLRGFFPAEVQFYKNLPRPIYFPGWVPNSVVLRQMWLSREISGLGALPKLTSQTSLKPAGSLEDLWQLRRKRRSTKGQIQLLGEEGDENEENEDEGDENDDEDEELDLDWASDYLSSYSELSQELSTQSVVGEVEEVGEVKEPAAVSRRSGSLARRSFRNKIVPTETNLRRRRYRYGHSLWEQRYGHLPRFLRFFAVQNWFKKLFPLFTLEAYPELGTVDGLASIFMSLLKETSWADRVHILRALLRLLPDMGRNLYDKLNEILVNLLNLNQPPSLQDRTQKQFVMLALQLLLACSLDSHEVVLELMSYFLYSPASCRPELKKLMDGLGLQDPEGFLFQEMMTWVQDLDVHSKAAVRSHCCQKLEEMIKHLQTETMRSSVARLSEVLPKVSEIALSQISSGASISTSGIPSVYSTPSSVSWTSSLMVSPRELGSTALDPQVQQLLSQIRTWKTSRSLSETLRYFHSSPDTHLRSSVPDALPSHLLRLEETEWSQSKMLDLGTVDALNFFCQQQRALHLSCLQEVSGGPCLSPGAQVPNAVVPQLPYHWPKPITRLQETKTQISPVRQRAPDKMLSLPWHREGRTIRTRMLKLPLPRVELRPFPLDWPRPARPLPPLLLQPALQRYFLPHDADPGNYR